MKKKKKRSNLGYSSNKRLKIAISNLEKNVIELDEIEKERHKMLFEKEKHKHFLSEERERLLAEIAQEKEKQFQEVEEERLRFLEERKKAESIYVLPEEIVELNVGGTFITTTLKTLCKKPNSMLAAMFSGRHPVSRDKNGRIFIDRNPYFFRLILTLLRTGISPRLTSENRQIWARELDYFLIDDAKYLYAIGGHDSTRELSSVEMFDPTDNIWRRVTPMVSPRDGAASVSYEDLIYVFGGEDGSQYLSTIERYDPRLKTWESSCLPRRRGYFACVHSQVKTSYISNSLTSNRDYIYIIGGHDGAHFMSTVDRFDPLTGIWTKLAKMKQRRSNISAATFNNNIYVFGGFYNSQDLSRVEKYNIRANKWHVVTDMPSKRAGLAAVTFGDYIYVLGGRFGDQFLDTVEKYNPITDKWSVVSSMKTPRCGLAAVCYRDHIYALGGSKDGDNFLDSVERYNPYTDEWNVIPSMTLKRSELSAVVCIG